MSAAGNGSFLVRAPRRSLQHAVSNFDRRYTACGKWIEDGEFGLPAWEHGDEGRWGPEPKCKQCHPRTHVTERAS